MAVSTRSLCQGNCNLFAPSPSMPSSLSSRSAFATSTVSVAPCKSSRTGPMTVHASSGEELKVARREMLATLLAASSVSVSSGHARAGTGPGIGAKKTAKKADELLKAGDELINNDSPPRFGGLTDANSSRIAQQAGSGPVPGIQGGAEKTIEGAKSSARKAQARIDGIFGKKKKNAVASNPLEDAARSVTGGVEDLAKKGPGGKIKSDVRTAGEKVKTDVATARGVERKSSTKAGNLVDQAQGKASSAVQEGKGLLDNFKDMVTNAIPQ